MSENKSLPALILEMSEIVAQLHENGGELTEVLEHAMDCTAQELQAKTDRYAFFMERLDAEADYWKQRADAFSKVSRSCKALKERLNGNIKGAMISLGQTDLEGNEMRFKLSALAPKLVMDETRIPAEWKMAVTEYIPDKDRIKAALQDGQSVPGAAMEEVFSLRKYPARKA